MNPAGFTRVRRKGWRSLKTHFNSCGSGCGCDEPTRIQAFEAEPKTEMEFVFQVAGVSKPLISVKRITEQGNQVSFGPKAEDNYICNTATGHKIMMRKTPKGSYVMDVNFVGGGKTSVTVDSGAEESVCPWEWGGKFAVRQPQHWMNLVGAGGDVIEHYGERAVRMISPF